jgi:zinc/manganese transport system substrate-binding protein
MVFTSIMKFIPSNHRARTNLTLDVVAVILGLVTLTGCSSGTGTGISDSSGRTINVVAGENFWGNIIAQIGGAHVKVTSIISDPNTDPHEYESDTHDAAALAKANFVLENGLGYDDFMDKLLSVSSSSHRDVLSVQKILNITGDKPNPHVWYDTARLPEVAKAEAAALTKIDPTDGPTFAANEQAFDASLTPILAVISQIKATYAGTKIAYTERVPAYLTDAAGLILGVPASFAQSVEDGSDPTPSDTAAFDAAITNKTVKVLLYNGQVVNSQTTKIKAVAQTSGVPIVGVSETLPNTDKTFQAWQLRQAQELQSALGAN